MRTWELIRQSLSSILRARTRSALTILGVTIACGALVAMVSFAVGIEAKIEEPFQELGLLNNIEVFPRSPRDREEGEKDDKPQAGAASAEDDEPEIVFDDDTIEQLEALAGVEYAYPDLRLSSVILRHGNEEATAFAFGVPREVTSILTYGELIIAGEFFGSESRPEIVIGEELVEGLGFAAREDAIGQEVELATEGLVEESERRFNLVEETLTLTVIGVYRPPSVAANFGRKSVLMPIELMKGLPGVASERFGRRRRQNDSDSTSEGYSRIVVRAASPGVVPDIEQAIRGMGYDTRALATRLENIRRFFVFLEILLACVGTVALLVAGLGILNTLLMSVLERYSEIGLYKAIGASSGDIRTMFLTEAAVLGFLGGLGGLLLAGATTRLIQLGIDVYARQEEVDGLDGVFVFPAWLLVSTVAFSMVISIVSGLYPAYRAASVDPIEALRRE